MNIKKKIRKAFTHATPNIPGFVCSDMKTEKGAKIIMKKPSKFSRIREFAATAAAIALLIGVGLGGAVLLKSGFTLGPANLGVGSETTAPIETTAPNETIPEEITIQLPDETFNAINGVYVTCENYDFTIYKGMDATCQLEFMLMSEKPLPEDAQIVLEGVEAEYKVAFASRTPEDTFTGLDNGLSEFLLNPEFTAEDYRAYLEEYNRLHKEWETLYRLLYGKDGRQPGEEYPEDHEYVKELKQAQEALFEIQDRYQESYDKYIAAEQRPEYYLYKVYIFFKSVVKEEQIKTMELIAGDMSRTITMKNVWIKPFDYTSMNRKGITSQLNIKDPTTGNRISVTHFSEIPEYNRALSSFTANEDITLKSTYLYGDNTRIKVKRAEVLRIDSNGTQSITEWIPGEDFLIQKGDKVAICIYWDDPYFGLSNYGMNASIVVEYTYNEEICKTWGFISRYGSNISSKAYQYYLLAFKGVDPKIIAG